MWSKVRRRFWFYDAYVFFYGESDHSFAKTNEALVEALTRWERGDGRVYFSGPRGGFCGAIVDGVEYP